MNILKQAITAHKNNNLQLAKKLYFQLLSKNPLEANANQLLGVILLQEGELAKAQHCLLNSLKSNPIQPHVWCNLAVCYSNQNLIEQSIDSYKQAINYKSDYIVAYKDALKVMRLNSLFSEAQSFYDASPQFIKDNDEIKNEQVKLLQATGKNKALISLYKEKQKTAPLTLNQLFNFAVLLRVEGKAKEALNHFLVLKDSGLDNHELNHNLGNSYSDLNNLDVAIDYYKNAVEHNPLYIDSHINLNELLWEKGRLDEFLVSYVNALQLYPNDAKLNFAYASALVRTENFKSAKDFLLQISNALQNSEEFYYLMGQCLEGENQYVNALEYQSKGVAFGEGESKHIVAYAINLMRQAQYDEAENLLRQHLEKVTDDQLALAYLGVCFRLQGKPEEKEINNYKQYVKGYVLEVPETNVSIEAFCIELNHYLSTLHTSTEQPLEQTLYKGTQTRGNLFNDENSYIQSLVEKISNCIQQYIKEIPQTGNPLCLATGNNFTFSGSWSVRLKKEGYHSVHVHPMGWLSAVFYVDLPKRIQESCENKEGWLKFGEPDLKLEATLPAEHYVKPQIGKLVIFPSYMWHGTIPLEKEGERTTIAFDIAHSG